MILLYDVNETEFTTNGIGSLIESTSCIVTENRNGEYDLKLTYPVDGVLFSELQNNRIIFCKPNPFSDPQPFRIYRISTPFKQEVAVYANHISYDLSGVPVSPFTAGSVTEAMQKMEDNAAVENPFEFYTDKVTTATMTVEAPTSSRSLLGGQTGSLLDIYGGEYEFDMFTVKLLNKRGQNNGVSLRYGKNITDVTQELNISSVYTGIYPYWMNQEDYVELPQKIVYASGTFEKQKIQAVDFSSEFEEQPTQSQLLEAAQEYIQANNIGIPKVNITVSFVALEQTEEYKDMALLEKVMLCDDVNVEFPSLGISTTAECVTTEYDAILDRYDSITLGEATTTIADTISGNTEEIKDKPSYSFLDKAVNNATNWITNGAGYMVAVKDEVGNWKEICSLDTPDIETAINVWRWNNGGFGHSSKGYNGPYETAITQDGQIVANFITAGEMNAGVIKTGLLKGNTGNAYFNLDTGDLAADKLIDPNNANRYVSVSQIQDIDDAYGLTYVDPVNSKPTMQVRGGQVSGEYRAYLYFPDQVSFYVGNDNAIPEAGLFISAKDSLVSTSGGVNMRTEDMIANRVVSRLDSDTFISLGNGTVSVNGNFTVTGGGTKNRAVDTESYGTVLLNAYETADCYFGDIGNAKIDDSGKCTVEMDPIFLETVNTEIEYVVFLQKNGPGDIWVENKKQTYFTISGTPGLSFSYEVKAKQKGYEKTRLEAFKNGATN